MVNKVIQQKRDRDWQADRKNERLFYWGFTKAIANLNANTSQPEIGYNYVRMQVLKALGLYESYRYWVKSQMGTEAEFRANLADREGKALWRMEKEISNKMLYTDSFDRALAYAIDPKKEERDDAAYSQALRNRLAGSKRSSGFSC